MLGMHWGPANASCVFGDLYRLMNATALAEKQFLTGEICVKIPVGSISVGLLAEHFCHSMNSRRRAWGQMTESRTRIVTA